MFKNAFRLPFRLLGIPVYLDITFLIILPILTWIIGGQLAAFLELTELDQVIAAEPLLQGATPYWLGLAAAVALFVSVVIHELGHAVTGRVYGVETERITLWLLGGMAQFRDMPRQRGAEAVVALAGPITSGALGALCFGILQAVPTDMGGLYFVLVYTGYMNIVLAVFNMIPALPLDGGRVLRSLLHLKMSRLRATQIAANISKGLAIALGLFGLLAGQLFLILIAFFVYIAVNAEAQYAMFTDALSRFEVGQLMSTPVETVPPEMVVGDVLQKMLAEARVAYPVAQSDGEFIGEITLESVQAAPDDISVREVMVELPGAIRRDRNASDLFDRMIRDDNHRLLVVDEQEFVVGIVTKTDLMRALQIVSAPHPPSQADAQSTGTPRR